MLDVPIELVRYVARLLRAVRRLGTRENARLASYRASHDDYDPAANRGGDDPGSAQVPGWGSVGRGIEHARYRHRDRRLRAEREARRGTRGPDRSRHAGTFSLAPIEING